MFKSKVSVSKKGTVIAILTALTLAMFSVTSAFAAGPTNSPTAAASTQAVTQSLEANWKAELGRYQFDTAVLDRVERFLDRFKSRPGMIDVSAERNEKGERNRAVVDANVLLTKAQAIVSSHAGFDAAGKMTDQTQASQSIDQLGVLLNQFRGSLFSKVSNLLHAS